MNFDPLRRLQSKLSAALVAAAALVLASCGGGGATSSPGAVGALQLLPGTASFYAGVPYTLNIVGGRKPYLVTSSEPGLIELNFTTDSNEFTFVARNPGVVDVGLDPDEVPRRTVNIEVRDSNGNASSNAYNVLQNFFTGYGESYVSTCASSTAGAAPQACSGSETLIGLIPISNGNLYGNREFQFDRVRGDYSFVEEPPGTTPQLVDRIRVRTDQTGRAFVRIRVAIAAPTQLASYNVTDVATGVTTNLVFLIVQQAPVGTITFIPNTPIVFQGTTTGTCGFGSSDVLVFGGAPPYTVIATNGIGVRPGTINASGDTLTISIFSALSGVCPSGVVTVIDSRGVIGTLAVSSTAGTTVPAAITVAPVPITITSCTLNTSSAAVVGGRPPLQVVSNHPRVSAIIVGNTLSVSRVPIGDGGTVYPATASLAITDGASITTVAVNVPAACP